MGNTFCCSCSPSQGQNEIARIPKPEVRSMQEVDDLIDYIDQIISKIENRGQECISKPILVDSLFNYGGTLIGKLSKRPNLQVCKKCMLNALHRETSKVVIDVLKDAELIPYLGMALSVIAHLLERAEKTSSNQSECLRLLRYMSHLAKQMRNLNIYPNQDKLNDIVIFIVQAALMCVRQMEPNTFCRFVFAPLDADDLEKIKSDLSLLYPDLALEVATEALQVAAEARQVGTEARQVGTDALHVGTTALEVGTTARQVGTEALQVGTEALQVGTRALEAVTEVYPAPSQGEYPHKAVGIKEAEDKVIGLLDLKDSSRRVVVVYGVGGIGKTTLATAVYNRLELTAYNYCRVEMDQDCRQTDLRDVQKQILRGLFKENVELNNCTEGREKLTLAFGKASNPPVFLFIDNGLRKTDLEKLLPIQHLSRLPMQSRILVTTRNLNEIKMLPLSHDIHLHSHRVDSIFEQEAKRVLCHNALGDENDTFVPGVNVDGLLNFCEGIPLVLRIVGSHLRSAENTASGWNDTLRYLKEWQKEGFEGGEEDLSERIVDFVYKRLEEPCKEAFLDIVFFFYNWERRDVSDIVGEKQLRDLEGAALVTTSETEWKTTVVKVHDILRARGRKLSPGIRVNDRESLSIVLSDQQKLQLEDNVDTSLEAKHLDLMSSSLRILSLQRRRSIVNGRCERAFEDLRFLYIDFEDELPIDLTKSSQLNRFEGFLRKGHRISEAKLTINLPESLRYLCLESNSPVSLDIHGRLTSLRRLILNNITFENLESSIRLGSFSCLQEFNLCNTNLETLPESIGKLSCLQKLILCYSNLETLPESIGKLSCLQKLLLKESNLETLPESIGKLSCLKFLDLRSCVKLKKLPDDMAGMTSLAAVSVFECRELEAKAMDSLVEINSLLFLDMRGSPMLERRWEEIRQHRRPLIGAASRFDVYPDEEIDYPDEEIMTAMFFNNGSRFLHVDGEGQLAEVASSPFPEVGVRVGLLLTAASPLSQELRRKLQEVASEGYEIMYVDVNVKREAEGWSWKEEREKRIRETLLQLPEGSRVWTSSFPKNNLLFAFSLWKLWRVKHSFDTWIVGTTVVEDEEGRRRLSHRETEEEMEVIFEGSDV